MNCVGQKFRGVQEAARLEVLAALGVPLPNAQLTNLR